MAVREETANEGGEQVKSAYRVIAQLRLCIDAGRGTRGERAGVKAGEYLQRVHIRHRCYSFCTADQWHDFWSAVALNVDSFYVRGRNWCGLRTPEAVFSTGELPTPNDKENLCQFW